MKVHYNNALRPRRNVVIPCGVGSKGGSFNATTNPAMVTCKRCFRMIGGTVARKDEDVECRTDGIRKPESEE